MSIVQLWCDCHVARRHKRARICIFYQYFRFPVNVGEPTPEKGTYANMNCKIYIYTMIRYCGHLWVTRMSVREMKKCKWSVWMWNMDNGWGYAFAIVRFLVRVFSVFLWNLGECEGLQLLFIFRSNDASEWPMRLVIKVDQGLKQSLGYFSDDGLEQ